MALPNIFLNENVNIIIDRINLLNENSPAQWGKMNVAQMLSHCNVSYELIYTNLHKKPNFLLRAILKSFVKSKVVSETPYIKNGPTGPQFIVNASKDFLVEKNRLIDYLHKTQTLGEKHFEQLPSHSFGPLSAIEWNNMMYKHLDHHLRQFGV